MLNPTFPKQAAVSVGAAYVAPQSIATHTLHGNQLFDSGPEYRLQAVYGEEIWLKLKRADLTPDVFNNSDVLEVCAGTGFLTFHLLSRCKPKQLTVNDLSAQELQTSKSLLTRAYPNSAIDWVLGDMHTLDFCRQFDIIIGNSFIHHFHHVARLMSRVSALLNPGGLFVSLHEPTPMSTVVEGAKVAAWLLAVLAPGLVNDIARRRYRGPPSATDLWLFKPAELTQLSLQAGFSHATTIAWGLFRPMVVQKKRLHLSVDKPELSRDESRQLARAVRLDSILNRFVPQRCFGSLCLICRK